MEKRKDNINIGKLQNIIQKENQSMKKTFTLKIILLLIFIIGFVAGCGGGISTPSSSTNSPVTIYTGEEYSLGAGYIPCYWDGNGVKHVLPVTTNLSYMVKSIFISNNVVYAGGYIDTSSGVACYWDNNGEHGLTISGATRSYVNSIFVKDNNVYACGYYDTGTAHVACYWKDSVKYDLNSNGYSYAHANSIFVDNTGVYVGGDVGSSVSSPNACYWANSTTPSTSLISNATVMFIFAYKNDVYSCCQDHSTNRYFSTYWLNTTEHFPAVPAGYTGHVTSIFVDNNSFYAGGYYSNGSSNVVCYWDNSGRYDLENTNDSVEKTSISILVKNNSVYVGGIKSGSSGDNAYYWDSKGGHPVYHFPQYSGWGFCPVFMQ